MSFSSFWFSGSEAELFRLLVGIDEARREIVCGLVDTLGKSPFYLSSSFRPVHQVPFLNTRRRPFLGTYTFAKTLEYAAKHNLQLMQGLPAAVTTPALSMGALSSPDAAAAQGKNEAGDKEKTSSKKGKDGATGVRKGVTVLPPAEYRARFLCAISGGGNGNAEEEGYFFVCPGASFDFVLSFLWSDAKK